jgi:hypothetical protein
MRLTDLEALKSFLMHGLYLHAGHNTAADLDIVQRDFAAIYRAVERMEERIGSPDEDQLLSDHCIAFEQWVKLDDAGEGWRKPKQLVQRILGQVDPQTRPEWIKSFSRRLRESYESALQMLDARDMAECPPLGDLTILGRAAPFWPLLLKCWKNDQSPGRPGFDLAVYAMRTFAFRSLVAGKRSDAGEPDLRNQARDFLGDFVSLTAHLNDMATWWSIPASFAFNLDAEDVYSYGSITTYILWKYENFLRSQRGRRSAALGWRTVIAPANHAVMFAKDHIEPKDAANPNLDRLVKWNPADSHARPFREVFLHRLGNLVLDNISKGSAKGSGDFASRIPHYARSDLLSQGQIVDCFASKDSAGRLVWDETAIRTRHASLVEFVKAHM